MNSADIEVRKLRLKELQTVIFSLADRLGLEQAYRIAETCQKRKFGSRLYRTYASYRACVCYHRKRDRLQRVAKKRSVPVSL